MLGTKSVSCGNSAHKPCCWRWPTRRERVLRAGVCMGFMRNHVRRGRYPAFFWHPPSVHLCVGSWWEGIKLWDSFRCAFHCSLWIFRGFQMKPISRLFTYNNQIEALPTGLHAQVTEDLFSSLYYSVSTVTSSHWVTCASQVKSQWWRKWLYFLFFKGELWRRFTC